MKFSDSKLEQDETYPWSVGQMERIVFQDCEVRVVLEDDGCFDEAEPSASQPVRVTAYHEGRGKLVDCHRLAFEHFIAHASAYEARLLKYLSEIAAENVKAALEADGSTELQAFIKKHGLQEPAEVKKQVRWRGLSLFDQGLDEVGLVAVDFRTGWDVEHGISILMHKGGIITHTGLEDLSNRGTSLLGHAKCLQEFREGYDIKL